MSDPRYQRQTALIHLTLAGVSLAAAVGLWWAGAYAGITGLLISLATNALIGWEKWDLLRRGKA
jgi:hypothetical protein